jgi:hypothetical protein
MRITCMRMRFACILFPFVGVRVVMRMCMWCGHAYVRVGVDVKVGVRIRPLSRDEVDKHEALAWSW